MHTFHSLECNKCPFLYPANLFPRLCHMNRTNLFSVLECAICARERTFRMIWRAFTWEKARICSVLPQSAELDLIGLSCRRGDNMKNFLIVRTVWQWKQLLRSSFSLTGSLQVETWQEPFRDALKRIYLILAGGLTRWPFKTPFHASMIS